MTTTLRIARYWSIYSNFRTMLDDINGPFSADRRLWTSFRLFLMRMLLPSLRFKARYNERAQLRLTLGSNTHII